ncbi:MAG: hypothetical protein ONB44_18415, partial [candidate division KSB1 bacterium]|nr:hypothetical protein [candidate division KSB1 bacterium]MDZ7312084.1 hypothetical protein [candidate division KSB1 bacterium]
MNRVLAALGTVRVVLPLVILLLFVAPSFVFAQGKLTSVKVTPSDSTAGAGTIYTVSFITSATGGPGGIGIPANGKIRLTFPAGFVNSTVSLAVNAAGGALTGGYLAPADTGQVLTLTRDGTGNNLVAPDTVIIKLASVYNSTVAGQFTLFVETLNSAGARIDTARSEAFRIVPGLLHHFTLNNVPTVSAGASFDLIIQAKDIYENTVTKFTGTVGIALNSGVISPTTSGAFSAGIRTESMTIQTAGSGKIISVTDGSGHTGTSNVFSVDPGQLHHFAVSNIPTPQTAGVGFAVTFTAQDQFNNTVTGFTGTVAISDSTNTLTPTTSGNFIAGVRTETVTIAQARATNRITVTGNAKTGSSNVFAVNVGPLDHFAISSISTVTAGTPFNFTITAKDAKDNTVTSFTGTINLSDNTNTLTPPTANITSNGTVTVTGAIITKAQSGVFITAMSGGNITGTSNTFIVLHGPLDHFAVTNTSGGNIGSQVAGMPFNIRLVAQDAYNNTATAFTGTVNLSNTTTSITPTSSGNFSSGVLASLPVTIGKASTADQISVSGGSPVKTGASNNFVVSAGTLAGFLLDPISSPQTAGTPFPLKITAVDANGNIATSFTGTVNVSLNSGTITPAVTTNFVNGVWNGNVTVLTSGTGKTITVTNGTFSATSNSFTVNPAAAMSFAVTNPSDGNIGSQTAGTNFSIKITAKDANGNVVTGFTGTVTLSDNTGSLTPTSATITSGGTVTVNNVKITKALASVAITASSGSVTGTSNEFAVTHAVLDHFSVTNTSDGNIASQQAGTPFNIKIVARDLYENIVASFTGSVALSNTTSSISPTTSGNFTNGVLASFSVTIAKTSAADVISVSSGTPVKTGNSNSFVVSSAGLAGFRLDPISSPQIAGTPFPLTITAIDANQNTVTSFTGTVGISVNSGTITPTNSGNFVAGVWNGNVTVLTSGANKTITVSDGTRSTTSNSFNVNPGLLDHFELASIAAQTAGANFTVTVTAKDANNNNVTHTGTVTLSDNTGTLTASSLVFSAQATQTVSDVKINKAQSGVFVTASGSGKNGFSNNFTVNPAALDHFTVTNTTGGNIISQTAGTAFNIRVEARDVYENTVTSFNQTVTITDLTTLNLTSANFVSGVLASQSVTINQARTDNQLTVTGGSPSRTGVSNLFNVIPGGLDHFTIDSITDQAAGEPFVIVIRARDAKDNVATSFNGTVTISDLTGSIAPATSGTFINGVRNESVKITLTRTNDIITVSGGGKTGSSNAFNVGPSTVDHFAITNIGNQTAGQPFSVTITALDASNNLVTSFNGTVTISDLSSSITPTTSNAFSGGTLTQNFTITKSYTGDRITVTGVGKTSTSNAFNVVPGPLHHFAINSISNQTAGSSFPITITAQDVNNNTVTGFTGTVTISINTGTIQPVTSGTFASGIRIESVTIAEAGNNRIINVNDGSGHSGSSNAFNVAAGGLDHFAFSTIATQAAGAAFSFTITAKDANNNDLSFNGTVTLSDNTTTLTPTSVTMNGVSVTVSNAQITKAQTGVMISATGGGKTGKSNAFTVQPGSLYRVRIVEGPSGDGPEVTTKSVTADDLLPLHAAGYDAFGNYREDPPVNWLMTNALGVFTPASSTSSTTFNPNKVGTTRLIADHASAIDDSTGNVVISTGAAYRVKVLLGAFGAGNEVGDVLLNTGEVLTVHASSFDRDDNRIQDVSVTWRVSGNIGTLSPLSGVSTTLTATRVGNGTITADHASLIDGYSGIITVSASTLSYVKIFEGTAGPPGAELGNKSITTDQTLSVYAAGFDASGNYVGDQEVTWSLSNSLGTLSPTFGRTTNFDPKRPGTLQIIATHATATGDNTGNISISAGNAHHIKILTGLSGATSEFLTDTLFTGQTREMHASSFDADDNWLGDVSVTWSVSNPIGSVAPTVGAATTFTATTAGSGVINARHSILGEDFTGTITVKPSSLNYVRIVEGPSGPGSKLGSKSFTTDQTVPVHAAGYDANNNYLGDVPVTWTVIGNNIGTFTTQSGASTTLLLTRTGVGRIVADHASAKDDTSGNLTISVGALHHVKVMSGNAGFTSVVLTQEITADETLAVHASGFDADDNYIDDFSVTWLVSGKIGTVSPAVGKSTILTARKVGVGQITADYADPNVTDGVTGAITVNPGRLAFIWVIEGPSGAGTQLGDRSLKADETLTLHAAGFDADTNYVADQSVTWSSAGSLAPAVSATGSNFTFAPTTAPASGTIRATHATAGFDETGTISVTVGSLNKIKILSGGSGKTTEVTGTTLPAGGTLLIHAGGFDSDDNYINDQIANWSVVGSIGTVNPANGFSTTFTATTPGTGAIRASVGSLSDNTGTIQVITGNIAKIVLRTASGNGGIAFGDHSMTADQEVIICAAGYDATNNYLGDFNVTWSNTGNLTPAVSATGSSFTFSPTLANANGTVNGKIIGTYSPTIKDTTGTITVYPGAPVGKISLTATPSGLPSDGSSRSTIVSGTIKDAELNNVGAGKRFTVTVTPSNLGTITTPDLDPATPDVQIETDASSQLRFEFKAGTTGGIASINVSSGLSANGSVQISLGSLDITDVTTVPATVSRGQQGISVGMTVRNLSSAPITDLTGQLTFTGSANRTGEYTVVPSPGNLTTLPGNSTTQLLFNVEVSNGATLETVTINGSVSGKIDGTVVNDNEATQTDSWTVQRAAVLSVLNVTTAPDTVARGQTGLAVTVRVANNLNLDNSASATIDSVKLVFKQGALDRTVEYVIAPDANNPTSITGNSTASFNFIVNVGLTASLGQVTLDARAHGKDANSNRAISDFNADAPDTWTVIEGEAFRIVSLTPSQPKVTAGMTSLTKEWNVRMTVENTGSSRIALNLAPDKTYIRFTIGTRDVTSEYNIIYPSALEEGGTELAARSTGHLTYRITRTGTSDGIAVISGAAEGQDRATGLTVFADTRISGTGEVNVQRPAVFRIDQLVLSQRTITQNMLKDWWIKAVVANAGGSDIRLHPSRDSIKVSIGNNAGYIYIRPSTFASGDTILAGNETDSLLIMVDKTGSQTGDLPVAVTLKGIEVNSNTLLNSNTANSTVTVQTPAALQILAVHPSRQTVSVGQTTPWTVTVVVKNNGGSQVSVKSDTSTNLRFRITQFQNDYNVSLQPTTWLGSASTNLAGNATDSLRFVVNTTGATPGFAFLWVKVAATENNSGVVVASPYHNSKSVQVQTRPNIVYMANSLRPKIVNNNSSYAFTVRVRNTGQATLQLEPDSTKLRFSAGAATYLASLDANQVRTLVPSVPGDTATLTFRSVAIPENMPQTTYTPVVELRGTENENNFSSNLTLTANELRVTQPAQVQILSVEPSQSTVTAHMTKPWNVTMIVRNNGNFRAKLDSVNLRLLSGIDVTREYGIVIPTNFLGSTTALLEAQRTDSLRFVINTTGNTLGNT